MPVILPGQVAINESARSDRRFNGPNGDDHRNGPPEPLFENKYCFKSRTIDTPIGQQDQGVSRSRGSEDARIPGLSADSPPLQNSKTAPTIVRVKRRSDVVNRQLEFRPKIGGKDQSLVADRSGRRIQAYRPTSRPAAPETDRSDMPDLLRDDAAPAPVEASTRPFGWRPPRVK